MKIIKAGNVKPKKIRDNCFKCGTIFEYTEKDIKTDIDPRETKNYVECPICKAFIYSKL